MTTLTNVVWKMVGWDGEEHTFVLAFDAANKPRDGFNFFLIAKMMTQGTKCELGARSAMKIWEEAEKQFKGA